jgi:hypothetical protein
MLLTAFLLLLLLAAALLLFACACLVVVLWRALGALVQLRSRTVCSWPACVRTSDGREGQEAPGTLADAAAAVRLLRGRALLGGQVAGCGGHVRRK